MGAAVSGPELKRINRFRAHNLLLAVEIDDLVLDSGGLSGEQEIEDTIDKLLKDDDGRSANVGQDGALRTSFGNVLVLERLRRGESVNLIEQVALIDCEIQEVSPYECLSKRETDAHSNKLLGFST